MSFSNLNDTDRAPDKYERTYSVNKLATCAFVTHVVRSRTSNIDASINSMTSTISLKADRSYVDASLNLRPLKTYVDASLNLRASQTYVDASLNLRPLKTYVDASLNTINNKLSLIDSSLNALAGSGSTTIIISDVSGLQTKLSSIDSSLNALIVDISNNTSNSGSSGITLDEAVLQIEIEGMRDIPLFAQNWMQNTSVNYSAHSAGCSNTISCSGNGQYIFIGLQGSSISNTVPQLSKDYGNTWLDVSPPFGQSFENATASAISSTGQYMIAINTANGVSTSNGIFYSSNYGSTWIWGNSSGTPTDSVAISSTGKYMLSATSMYLTISKNYGTNFTSINSLNNLIDPSNGSFRGYCHAVAMSTDASIMYTTTHYRVWKSTDFGSTWAVSNNTGQNYSHISCSANGKYVLVCPFQGAGDLSNNLFVSKDYGVTFSSAGDVHSYAKGSVSACGRYMLATDGGYYGSYNNFRKGYVYASDDYGVTWNQINGTNGYYTGVAMSHSGNMIYTQSSKYYGDVGHLYVSNSNYSTCVQTVAPYGSVPGGSMYFNQSTGKLNIYNSAQSAWYSVSLTPPM